MRLKTSVKRRRPWLTAALLGSVVWALMGSAPALAAAPFSWSSPQPIDPHGPTYALSCPTESFCIAVDGHGDAVTSNDPFSATPTWKATDIDGEEVISDVSCVGTEMCAAVDLGGKVVTSLDPSAASPTWKATEVTGKFGQSEGSGLEGISCPSVSLCAVVGPAGYAWTSTDPTAASSSWSIEFIADGNRTYDVSCPSISLCVGAADNGMAPASTDPSSAPAKWSEIETGDGFKALGKSFRELVAVSCVAETAGTLCVADDKAGNVLASTAPASGSAGYPVQNVDGTNAMGHLSCFSTSLCLATDKAGNVVVSTDPAAASPTWTVSHIDGSVPLRGVSCVSPTHCLAVDEAGNALYGTPSSTSGTPTGTSGGGSTTSTTPTGSGSEPTVGSGAAAHASVTGTSAHAVVSCTGATNTTCTLTLTLSVVETLEGHRVIALAAAKRAKRTKRTVVIGSQTVTLHAGSSQPVTVALNATGRKLLSSHHHLSVRLAISQGSSARAGFTLVFKQSAGRRKG
jgi:hypothetical protein